MRPLAPRSETATGMTYALLAYFAWGVMPALWKVVASVPPFELIAHRVLWSFVFVTVLVVTRRLWPEVRSVLADPRRRTWMLASTALISTNWFLFIWAVATDRVMQASLGYYINPLFNVLLGRLFLGERLRPAQAVAVALASAGVVNLAVAGGELPWVSLLLAVTFGFYGLVRKKAPVAPLTGLAVETGLVAPLAVAWLGLIAVQGSWELHALEGWRIGVLVASGGATALPLLWFAHGARRLRYSTLGIIQYLAPTLQLALAVLVFGEAFTPAHALTFACIWTAVAIYVGDAFWKQKTPDRTAEAPRATGVSG